MFLLRLVNCLSYLPGRKLLWRWILQNLAARTEAQILSEHCNWKTWLNNLKANASPNLWMIKWQMKLLTTLFRGLVSYKRNLYHFFHMPREILIVPIFWIYLTTYTNDKCEQIIPNPIKFHPVTYLSALLQIE